MNRLFFGIHKNSKVKDDPDLLAASYHPRLPRSQQQQQQQQEQIQQLGDNNNDHHDDDEEAAVMRLENENDDTRSSSNSRRNHSTNKFDGGPATTESSFVAASSSMPLFFGRHRHSGGDDNDADDDDESDDDVTFGYRSALTAYANTIPPALSNDDGMRRRRGATTTTTLTRGGQRRRRVAANTATSSRGRNHGESGLQRPALDRRQQQQLQYPQSLLDNHQGQQQQQQQHVKEDNDDMVPRGSSGEGGSDPYFFDSYNKTAARENNSKHVGSSGGCDDNSDTERRQSQLHPPLQGDDHLATFEAVGHERLVHLTTSEQPSGPTPTATTMTPPQNFNSLVDRNQARDGIATNNETTNGNPTAFTTIHTDGSIHRHQHHSTINSSNSNYFISPNTLTSFRHGSRTNHQQQQQQQQQQLLQQQQQQPQHQYRDDHLSVSSQTPSNAQSGNDMNNDNLLPSNNNTNHLVLQPGAFYEERYGDAYVDQTIFYLYPAGYQSMRPRSGPWKLSIFVFVVFLWLSVFTVAHCYDRGKREYNPYFERADDEYLQDVTDDALVMETRWCGSKVLYFMWMLSIWITVLSLSYCSIIGYVKIRDVVVANGRSQPPGIGGGGGRSDYYVAVKNVIIGSGGGEAGAGMTTVSVAGGSDVTSPSSSAGLYPSYQVGSDRNRSIYQTDGTPLFWGGHIYRPTQAAAAMTNRP